MDNKSSKGPGRSDRKGISVMELAELFPDEESARKWFEDIMWGGVRCCGHCGSTSTKEVKGGKPMPYWCTDCRSYFSVRTGSALQNSRLPLRKWAFGVYLYVTSVKGVSSMKLHRDLKITQKTAWFMLHRLREAWEQTGMDRLMGPTEVDETWVGGKRKNMHGYQRAKLRKGAKAMTPVVGMIDRDTHTVRAAPIKRANTKNLLAFIRKNAVPWATVYTDSAAMYDLLKNPHEVVNHSEGEYVRGVAHTNSIESFWALLKRAHKGTHHHWSRKHLHRYITEFAGRHNTRDLDTIDQMQNVATGMVGKQLMYRDLVED